MIDAGEKLAQSPAQFRDEPAIYERIARAGADAALTDLLEQHDGHLPPDYDGDHEPQWEPLTTKEWEAYQEERGQWLEVAQFATEERAQQCCEDFMSLAGSEKLGHITGPMLAGVIADDLEMDSRWQIMDQPALDRLKADEWVIVLTPQEWQPRMDEMPPTQTVSAASVDLDL